MVKPLSIVAWGLTETLSVVVPSFVALSVAHAYVSALDLFQASSLGWEPFSLGERRMLATYQCLYAPLRLYATRR